MKVIATDFPEIKVIVPQVFQDNRGFFQESFNLRRMQESGLNYQFVQDNHSFSVQKYTIRALHFQTHPMAQAKLVRVVKGSVLDVVVDIRRESKNFGKFITFELSDQNHYQILIPKGFAHGFCTLMEDCHVIYKVDEYYSPAHNQGIIWNDPTINIPWPTTNPVLSKQDEKWQMLHEVLK
ncbi:MAG: dTDP-4-dehydrorhamnose 3,5-epimerase [Bdellovibrionota bacterium]